MVAQPVTYVAVYRMLRPYRRLSRSSLHSRQTFHVKDPHQSRCARQLCLLHASRAFGAQAAPRRSFLCRAACGFQAAVHVYFVGLKNATRPTNCRTGEASLDYRCRNSSASFQDASPLPEIIAEQLALSLNLQKNTSVSLRSPALPPARKQSLRHASSSLGKLNPPVQGATMIQSPK